MEEAAEESAAQLSEDEKQFALEVFSAYDYDLSGYIDRTELRELLMENQWCMDSNLLDEFVRTYLGEDVREVRHEQFLELYGKMLARHPSSVRKVKTSQSISVVELRAIEAECRAVFEKMDPSKTGFLSESDLRTVLRESNLPDTCGDNYETLLLEQLDLADHDENERWISFDEFVRQRSAVLLHFYDLKHVKAEAVLGKVDPWGNHFFAG